MVIESYTTTGSALSSASSSTWIAFPPGQTAYLMLELVSRGPGFGAVVRPSAVSRDKAIEVVRQLVPVGMAVEQPISQP